MATEVESQMAGSVFRVECKVGDVVEADRVLLIIESMKMEIPVEAPVAGRVVELCVEPGQTLAEGDLLLVIEE